MPGYGGGVGGDNAPGNEAGAGGGSGAGGGRGGEGGGGRGRGRGRGGNLGMGNVPAGQPSRGRVSRSGQVSRGLTDAVGMARDRGPMGLLGFKEIGALDALGAVTGPLGILGMGLKMGRNELAISRTADELGMDRGLLDAALGWQGGRSDPEGMGEGGETARQEVAASDVPAQDSEAESAEESERRRRYMRGLSWYAGLMGREAPNAP